MGFGNVPTKSAIIEEINNSKENGFTQEEISRINEMMIGLDEPGLTEVKNYIQTNLSQDVIVQLSAFRESVENQNYEYSIEGLKQGNQSEIFGKFLDLQMFGKNAFDSWLELRLNNEKLDSSLKDKVGVIMWNKVITEIGIVSGMNYGINSLMNNIKDSFSKVNLNSKSLQEGEFELSDIGTIIDSIKDFDPTNDKADGIIIYLKEDGTKGELKVPKGIEKINNYIDSLVDGYFKNLSILLNLGKDKNQQELNNLLDNPIILNQILDTGEYNENGFNIDLSKGILEFGNNSQEMIIQSQKDFMLEVVENTNDKGKTIDGILKNVKGFANMFDKIGIGKEEFEDLKNKLINIPIVGFFFKILFGDFFNSVGNELAKLSLEREIKDSIIKFEELLGDTSFIFPFTNDTRFIEEGEREDSKNLIKFLENVKNIEKKENKGEEVEQSIISDELFWKNIFSKESIGDNNSLIERVRKAIIGINSNNDPMTQEEFIKNMGKIEIQILEEQNLQSVEEEVVTPKQTPVSEQTVVEEEVVTPKQTPVSEQTVVEEEVVTPKQTPVSEQTVVEEEVVTPKQMPVSEQISQIKTLPSILVLNGKETSIDLIDNQFVLLGKTYNISLEAYNNNILTNTDFNNGKLSLSYNVLGNSGTEEIGAMDLAYTINEILKNGSYIKNVRDGVKLEILPA